MDYLQIARDLIAIESITGNEEPVVAYLESALQEMGLDVRSEEAAPGRRNIMAGPERPRVLFCTHTDTVPPFLSPSEDDEFLHGRGACDTKGISAALLGAGVRLLEKGVRDFGYLFVVGEEVDNAGAIAANRSVRADYIVVGEPTENRLAVGHKGAFGVRVKVSGRACHSAYPDHGDSAVHRLLRYLARVQETDFGSSDILGPSTSNIGVISGGVAHNVLAPSAEAQVMIRVVSDIDELEARFRECFVDPETRQHDERVELDVYLRMLSPNLERLEGFEETIVSYGTDLPFLADVGKPLLFGPGSILDAHTATEKISKAQIAEAVDKYVEIAESLIARDG
jgi:acetylornithine deacetylase